MLLEEGIRRLHANPQEQVLVLSPVLQRTIDDSHVRDVISKFGSLESVVTKESVIEAGKKMTLTLEFNQGNNTHSQVVISVTEGAIAFCGDIATKQYIRLENEDLRDGNQIEDALAHTIANPLRVNNTQLS